jgi:RNA polymerase sigma factor (sigma-70 family)
MIQQTAFERVFKVNKDGILYDPSQTYILSRASDEALVEAAKSGEKLAFVEICNRYAKWVSRTIYRITRNEEDAEDALQEAFLSAFIHLKSFDGRSKFSTWLTRIAINSALMTLRKRRKRPEASIEICIDEDIWTPRDVPDQTTDIESSYIQCEREFHLKQAIRRLKPSLREVIEIQCVHDGSVKEIAKIAGISVAATKSRLIRARVALRRSLRSYGTHEYKENTLAAVNSLQVKKRSHDEVVTESGR